MIGSLKQKFKDFFSKGHERTIEAKKNIVISFAIKGLSIAINLALVPLTINYVNPTQYGIWLTLSSVVSWFSFFDIGLGGGLRNKFAEAKAIGNLDEARIYVSTTYAVLSIVFVSIWLLFIFVNNFIDWTKILNTSPEMASELSGLALIVFSFFCIQMILKTINIVLIADQKPAKAATFDMLGQLIALVIIFVLTQTTKGSLIYLGLSLGAAPVFILLVSSIYFYSKKYNYFSPSIKWVNFHYAKDIMKLGASFFLIQIAIIVVYQSNNFIILQIGSPKDVTVFNIAYKYMSISYMVFSIIMGPFWSAFTDAFFKADYLWMKSTLKKLRIISYLLILSLIFLVLVSDYAYKLWIGNSIEIPFKVSLAVGVYMGLLIVISANTQILYGIGKIRIQLITYSLATIFHIPLAFYLGRQLGIIGVLSSVFLFYAIISLFSTKQVNLLINKKAKGIWNK